MTNTRPYLDSINAGRKRRPTTSLEELSQTLDEIESRISSSRDDRSGSRRLRPLARHLASGTSQPDEYDMPFRERAYPGRSHSTGEERRRPLGSYHRQAPSELDALREDLHQQLSTGLRREFGRLREDIETALHTAAPTAQVAELGVEFERLAAMIHKIAHRTDDRQLERLRVEMEEVKGVLGKLAREDIVRSFDRRWEELDRRWSDLAAQMTHSGGTRGNDEAVQALHTRLEEVSRAVSELPASLGLKALEDEVRSLVVTVDRIAQCQDYIAPHTLAAIEDRLDELSRAIAASAAHHAPPAQDSESLDRIEARIANLAQRLGDMAQDGATAALAEQLGRLSGRVEEIAVRIDTPADTIDRLAAQLETISRKLDHAPVPPDLSAVLEGIEDRVASLSGLLSQRQDDAFVHGHSVILELERRLDQVASRLSTGDPLETSHDADLLEQMDMRFAALESRLEQSAAPGVDPDLIRSLEAQIADLAAHISQPEARDSDAGALIPRLDQIERSIAESRRDVMEAARTAAEEAVRSLSGSAGDGTLAAGLAEDLKALEALTRRSDDRNAKTFEAIHDTLLKIVDRLGAVEAARASEAPAPAEAPRDMRLALDETPSIAATSDAMPLDAGPGEPDSRNLMRMGETKRTAAASAAEAAAEAATREEPQAGTRKTSERGWKLGGITRAFSGRRASAEAQNAPDRLVPSEDNLSEAPLVELDEPLDPQIINRPLEPGSGAPDLNAIMRRVRDERSQGMRAAESDAAKADFIAAARRAAQAAAAEAEVMKRSPQAKSSSGKFTSLLGNSRKPVLLGVAAVLVALAALQFGRSVTGAPEPVSSPPLALSETTADTAQVASPEPAPQTIAQEEPAQLMAMVTEQEADMSADWLENAEPITAEPATSTPVTQDVVADEPVPQNDEIAPLAIPLDAGPAPLRDAAEAGNPNALFEIGNRHAEGRGVKADMAQAADWYRQAADKGHAPAQYRLGNMYEKGIGLERDVAQAVKWYTLAAEQGNASAMHNLAVLHAMGAEGSADNAAAALWFEKAAEYGVKDSQFNLGILSAKGVGTEQNLEEAYKWFALVAETGDRDAAQKRDEIANALRPEQLENARAAATLWKAKPLDAAANGVEIPESWRESVETTSSVDMKQAIRNIQIILNKNGYQAGSEDGVMGQKTTQAIAAFQKDNGMPATGEVDEELVRALLERR